MANIGAKIAEILKIKGISVIELSKQLGISNPATYAILKRPNIDTGQLEKIAEIVGVPISYFFDDTNHPIFLDFFRSGKSELYDSWMWLYYIDLAFKKIMISDDEIQRVYSNIQSYFTPEIEGIDGPSFFGNMIQHYIDIHKNESESRIMERAFIKSKKLLFNQIMDSKLIEILIEEKIYTTREIASFINLYLLMIGEKES